MNIEICILLDFFAFIFKVSFFKAGWFWFHLNAEKCNDKVRGVIDYIFSELGTQIENSDPNSNTFVGVIDGIKVVISWEYNGDNPVEIKIFDPYTKRGCKIQKESIDLFKGSQFIISLPITTNCLMDPNDPCYKADDLHLYR